MKNSKILTSILAIFLAIFLIGSVSAISGFSIDPNNRNVEINHGESNSNGEIIIQNKNESMNITDIRFELSENDINLSILTDVSGWIVESNTNSSPIKYKVSVPKHTSPGVYSEKIGVDVNFTNNTGTYDQATKQTLDLSINVTESPKLELTIKKDLTRTSNGTVEIKNTGNVNLNNVEINTSGSADFDLEFNETSWGSLNAGSSIPVKIMSSNVKDLGIEDDDSIDIIATSNKANSSKKEVKVGINFCEDVKNEAGLEVKDFEITTKQGFGEDEDYWYPLDRVEIEFDVENDGDYDVEDIEIEICLLEVGTGNCIMDEEDMDLSDDNFDLDSGDDNEGLTATFEIDPEDLEEGEKDFEFHIKATGDIDDSDAPESLDGDSSCAANSEDNLEIRQEEFVILGDVNDPETVECDSGIIMTGEVWNIDEDDIDEEDIFLQIYNKKLGISKTLDLDEGIDALDNREFSVSLNIPEGMDEGDYEIDFIFYDDEDMGNDDLFELDNEDDDESIYHRDITIEGNCQAVSNVNIVADYAEGYENGGEAGEELKIKSIISNIGEEDEEYSLSVEDYSEWADSAELEPNSIELDAGEAGETIITFDVKEDVSGEKTFTLKTVADGKTSTQPITVTIDKDSGFLDSITGDVITEDNWYLWVIGLINVILVVVIILVVVKLLKKNK